MNTEVFFLIHNFAHQNFMLDNLMILAADYLIFAIFIVLGLMRVFGYPKHKMAFAVTLISVILVSIIIKIINYYFFIPRPFVSFPIITLINGDRLDSTFPSQHTSIMAAATFSYYYYHSRLFPYLLFLTLIIGFSRIFVGVHYPLDILGGLILGSFTSFITIKCIRYFIK